MNNDKNNNHNRWDDIYRKPEEYQYYDLNDIHPDMCKVADYFKKQGVEKVLDVGCGIGSNMLFLARLGFTLTGIDSSPNAINRLNRIIKKTDIAGKAVVANFQDLPFPSQVFDAVISVQTINHGKEDEVRKAIAEIERVLFPGGVVFITVPGRVAKGEVRYSLIKTAEQISERVYVPTKGREAGMPHFIFNKRIIKNLFANFHITDLWHDERDYYSFLATKKEKNKI
jgi:SAM-dependent methyltransferase